jgi:1,4-alpha-glucan branching enzyme
MRVAITTPFFPPHPGGLERHVYELASGLSKRGFDVHIVTSDIKAPKAEPDLGYEIIRLPSKRIGFDCIVSGLRQTFDRIRPDIVHSHAPLSIISSQTSWLIGKSKPLLCTYHGDYYKKALWERMFKVMRNHIQLPYVLHHPRFTIALTDYDRRLLKRYGIDDRRIRIIYPGIDIARYRRDLSGNIYDGNMVLYVGRVVYEKGIKELLMAFKALSERHDDAKLVVAGTGYALNDMVELSKDLGLVGKVDFKGWVLHEDLHELYQKASFVVLPSFSEGLPYVVLEAMASGQALVATNVSGMNEAVVHERSGILYEVGDSDALLKAMLDLIDDPERCERMGRFGAEYCRKGFSTERWFKETVRLYEEAA